MGKYRVLHYLTNDHDSKIQNSLLNKINTYLDVAKKISSRSFLSLNNFCTHLALGRYIFIIIFNYTEKLSIKNIAIGPFCDVFIRCFEFIKVVSLGLQLLLFIRGGVRFRNYKFVHIVYECKTEEGIS